MVSYRLSSLAIVVVLMASNGVRANSLEDTHLFRLGVYEQDVDVIGAVARDPFPKVDIDFDKVLGLEDSSRTAFLSYRWRFGDKWSMSTFYSKMESSGKKVATRDFNYNGQEYSAGVALETEFNLDTYLIAADYSLIRDQRKEVGVGFGIHVFEIESIIAAEAGIGGVERSDGRTKSEVLAPLPNFRVFGTYLMTDRWEVSMSAGWLSFTHEDFEGGYLYLNAFTEYRFTKNFGLGLSYQIAEIDVDQDDGNSRKEFDIDLFGPSVFLTYGF